MYLLCYSKFPVALKSTQHLEIKYMYIFLGKKSIVTLRHKSGVLI